jgi:hypothetical protein
MMRKVVLILVAAASLAFATVATPDRAEARCYGCWAGAGVAVGLIAGAALAGSYGYGGYGGYGYYGSPYGYGYGYAPAYYAPRYAYYPGAYWGPRYRYARYAYWGGPRYHWGPRYRYRYGW